MKMLYLNFKQYICNADVSEISYCLTINKESN